MGTLADDLVAMAARVPPELRPLEKQFKFVAEKIKKAQRFVVAPGAHTAIRAVMMGRPSSLATAVRFASIPYPTCWFEWIPPEDAVRVLPGQCKVKRCGALLQQEGGPNEVSMFTAWKFDDDVDLLHDKRLDQFPQFREIMAYGVSSIQGGFDFSNLDKPTSLLSKPGWIERRIAISESREYLEAARNDKRNGVKYALKDEREREALVSIEKRCVYRVIEEIDGYEMLEIARQSGGEEYLLSAIQDVSSEIGHIIGTLILMNSKNCVEFKPVEPPPKLNKARRKAGKTELLPYSTVEITLNRPSARAAEDGRGSAEAMRLHLVRGHFKVRKTGVYWWHHHMRGDESVGVVERKGHIINAG